MVFHPKKRFIRPNFRQKSRKITNLRRFFKKCPKLVVYDPSGWVVFDQFLRFFSKNHVDAQTAKWCAHVIRCDNDRLIKQTMFDEAQNSRVGMKGVSSVLDQFLKITRTHDFEDADVYRACIARNLFYELDERGVLFAAQHVEIE